MSKVIRLETEEEPGRFFKESSTLLIVEVLRDLSDFEFRQVIRP